MVVFYSGTIVVQVEASPVYFGTTKVDYDYEYLIVSADAPAESQVLWWGNEARIDGSKVPFTPGSEIVLRAIAKPKKFVSFCYFGIFDKTMFLQICNSVVAERPGVLDLKIRINEPPSQGICSIQRLSTTCDEFRRQIWQAVCLNWMDDMG